jgi:hypothetical protein
MTCENESERCRYHQSVVKVARVGVEAVEVPVLAHSVDKAALLACDALEEDHVLLPREVGLDYLALRDTTNNVEMMR